MQHAVTLTRRRLSLGASLRRCTALLYMCAITGLAASPSPVHAQAGSGGIKPAEPMGINLSAVNYYSTQVPFENVFRNRDDWEYSDGTDDDAALQAIPRDAQHYPLQIPTTNNKKLRAYTFFPVYPTYVDPSNPANDVYYRVTFSGSGALSFGGPGLTSTQINANEYRLQVPRSLTEPVWVQIESSSAANHITNIQVVPNAPITNDFNAMVSGFRVIRFMDWAKTNNNTVTKWSPANSSELWVSRTLPGQAEGSDRGAAIETMVETANKFKADLWYNVPPMVDDTFITNAAQLIANTLDPSLKVYVEYANENWNASTFTHPGWQATQGVALNYHMSAPYASPDPGANYWAGIKYSVNRAAKTHKLFRQVLGKSRVVAVIGGQNQNTDISSKVLELYRNSTYNPLWTSLVNGVPSDANAAPPDVLAVGSYVDVSFGPADASLSVAQILSRASTAVTTAVGNYAAENFKIAHNYNARLVAYESGQHLLAVDGLQEDASFVQKLKDANRSAAMGDIYRAAQRAWIDNGGGLAVHFNSCENPSKYGTWGALEYQDQPVATAPKMVALKEFQGAPDRVVAILTKVNQRYVSANNSGASNLINDRTTVGGWERFILHMNTDGSYSLKALVNGNWVSTDYNANPNGALIANRTTIGNWEKFDLVPTSDGYLALRSIENRKFVRFSSTGTDNAYPSAAYTMPTTTPVPFADTDKVTFIERSDHVIGVLARTNMRYTMADNAGANPLVSKSTVLGNWERFSLASNVDNTISFQAVVNNKYVSGGSGGGTSLIANQTSIGAGEKFQFIPTVDGYFAVRSPVNYKFLTFDPNGTSPVSARATMMGPWESVSFSEVPERPFAVVAKSNGRYLTATNGGASALTNNATALGGWERFVVVLNSDGSYSFRSFANGLYVCADNNGASPLIANRQSIGAWEKFELWQTVDGYVAFKFIGNGKFVTFGPGGGTVTAAATSIGDWEKVSWSDL